MSEERFTWEYSNYDSTGEIYDWIGNRVLITDYLQKWELEEWCQELNELNDENKTFREALKELKEIGDYQEFYIKELQDENTELEKENEHLKKRISELEKEVDDLSCGEADWLIEEEL